MRRTIAEHLTAVQSSVQPALERLRLAKPDIVAVDTPELRVRVTAAPISTRVPIPPFDNSQMDGYAVRASDLASASPLCPVSLLVGRATAAGDPISVHRAGTASPIMTGAVIPHGADAVVPVEMAAPSTFGALSREGDPAPYGAVSFAEPVPQGRFIRREGEDAAVGTEILPADVLLSPARIGVLAAAGLGTVSVRPKPRILLCSTGDELVHLTGHADTAQALPTGLIHDANTPMLAAALRSAGADVRTLRSGDHAQNFRNAIIAAAAHSDLIVTSGGISAGAFEVVREALTPLGIAFVSVAMQPGGPQGLGELERPGASVPVICFPGNPVSALISAEIFLLPMLREYAGLPAHRQRNDLRLSHDADSPADKHQVRRGRLEPNGRVSLSAPGSHLLSELAAADVLVHLPMGRGVFPENTLVETWRIHD